MTDRARTVTKRNGVPRRPKGRMSVRLDSEILIPMQRWAGENGLPLSWVVTRVLRMGWPMFMRQEAPRLQVEEPMESMEATA